MWGAGWCGRRFCPQGREKITAAKAQLESKQASTGKDNKRDFYKYVHSKRGISNSIGPWLHEICHPKNSHVENAHLMSSSLLPSTVIGPGKSGVLLENHDCWGDDKISVHPECVWGFLLQLEVHKSWGLVGSILGYWQTRQMSLWDLTQFIFQRSWESGEVPLNWKLANIAPDFREKKKVPGDLRPVSLISVPGKIMEKVVLGVIEKHSSHWLQPAQVHVLLKQLKFIHSWPRKVRNYGVFWISAKLLILFVTESLWINAPAHISTSPWKTGWAVGSKSQ